MCHPTQSWFDNTVKHTVKSPIPHIHLRIKNTNVPLTFTFVSWPFEVWLYRIRSGRSRGLSPLLMYHHNLRSIIPTSTPLMPAFTLTLQGNFYDPITQGFALSDLGVRSRFRIVSPNSTQVLCDLCLWNPAVLFVWCVCTSGRVALEQRGCEEDQLFKHLLVFLTVKSAVCIQVFCFFFFSSH